jgi:methionine salvage enolase-phosphatase E1
VALWLLAALVLMVVSSPDHQVQALIPFLDGGKDIPKLYNGYFDSQIAKQASTAVRAAISSGKINIEVNLPAVPNLEEVRFG